MSTAALAQLQPCTTTQQAKGSGFKIKNAGITVDGAFANASFTVAQTEGGFSISATAEVRSLDTGIGMRDNHLRSADYFDAERYPTISFRATNIKPDGNGNYTATGTLTIKNVSQTITIPVTLSRTASGVVYGTTFTLDRTVYGVGKNHWTLSNDVRVALGFVCPQ
jgi:polyisoprenoid-binding protein YceI